MKTNDPWCNGLDHCSGCGETDVKKMCASCAFKINEVPPAVCEAAVRLRNREYEILQDDLRTDLKLLCQHVLGREQCA